MNDFLSDRLPPQSLEAEQAVLGSCLISKKVVPTILATLQPEDFYLDAHRRVMEAIHYLFSKEIPSDVTTVPEELRRRGVLDQIGGTAYINTLSESVATSAHAQFYADTVLETAELRRMIDDAASLTEQCYARELTADEIREAFVLRMLQRKRQKRIGPQKMSLTGLEEFERIDNDEAVPVMLFGIQAIDDFCGGLERTDVGVISGLPGSGKTALLDQIVCWAAENWGKGLIFSREINKKARFRRNLARVSGIPYRHLRDAGRWVNGEKIPFTPEEKSKILGYVRELEDAGDKIDVDDSTYTVDGMVATAHELQAREGLEWVAVDYMQLIEVRGTKGEKRNTEVEAVTLACKNRIATDLNIPCLCISSLTKEGQGRNTPILKDLAESVAISYLASLIMMLVADTADDAPVATESMTPIIAQVAKSRNDQQGPIPLMFHKKRFLITGRDTRHTPPPVREQKEWWDEQ